MRSRKRRHTTVTTTSSLPVSTILRTVWDDLGELSVRLRSQSIICLYERRLLRVDRRNSGDIG
jgi:hypothetical protein